MTVNVGMIGCQCCGMDVIVTYKASVALLGLLPGSDQLIRYGLCKHVKQSRGMNSEFERFVTCADLYYRLYPLLSHTPWISKS